MRIAATPAMLVAAGVLLCGCATHTGSLMTGKKEGRRMTDGTKIQLIKDDSSAVIHGFEKLEWYRALFDVDVSGIRALTAALQASGHDVTFEEVMGISGAAFKLHMGKQWCPSSGCFEFNDEIAGFFGLERQVVEMDEKKDPKAKERMRKAVVASIDRGMPVPYCDGEHSLVVGYRDNGAVLVCRQYSGPNSGYKDLATPRGALGEAWWFDILTKTVSSRASPAHNKALHNYFSKARF